MAKPDFTKPKPPPLVSDEAIVLPDDKRVKEEHKGTAPPLPEPVILDEPRPDPLPPEDPKNIDDWATPEFAKALGRI